MNIETPAFIIDESEMKKNLDLLKKITLRADVELLFSIKSLAEPNALKFIKPRVSGFSTSSLFETRLDLEAVGGNRDELHIVTPGLDAREIEEISEYAGHITYNSIDQAKRLHKLIKLPYVAGLRINPEMSFVDEGRYDPCKLNSKLGVPISEMFKFGMGMEFISGFHFHSNCDSNKASNLLETVKKFIFYLGDIIGLSQFEWINIGGGYLYNEVEDMANFYEAVELLKGMGLRVMMEPGGTVVKSAGSIVTTVTDVFKNKGVSTAILDTSVNHMPEILEYLFQYDIEEDREDGKHNYLLAGPTCLAGDEFGDYVFENELKVGDRLTFKNVGAYTMVKAHTFNGVNLPTIYTKKLNGDIEMQKQFDFAHYKSRWE